MATDFDRDDRLHGPLRDTLRRQPVTGPCVDAATLAAWADHALPPEETAAIDTHLAACAPCRELAATLSMMPEAEHAPAAAVVPFAPRPNGTWKVIVAAMGTIAASALIWVAVRDTAPARETTSADIRAAQREARSLGGKVPQPAAAPAQAAESSAPARRGDAARDAELLQGQSGQQGQRASAAPLPEANLARENTARAGEPNPKGMKPPPAPMPRAVPPPPPPPPPQVAPPPATAGAARPSTVAGPPQSTINIDTTGVKNQADLMRSPEAFFAIPPVIVEFVAGADRQVAEGQGFGAVADRSGAGGAGRGGGAAAGGRAGGAAVRQEAGASASAPPVQWRIHGPSPSADFPSMSALARSTDAGKTWQPIPIEAKTPQLAAGSAPANTVCWLVGRTGTVLLSTDGTTFRQVTRPADADLVSVRAADARSATVRTADGRTFATTDGGATWVR